MNITDRATQKFRKKFVSTVTLLLVLSSNIVSVESKPASSDSENGSGLQAATTLNFVAAADAYVEQLHPNANNGTADFLQVENASNRATESYIRFTVSGVSGTVQTARLRVYVTANNSADGPALYTTGNSWTENGITWNNRPGRTSGVIDNKGAVAKNTWVEYDVTTTITGNGTFNFVLAGDSSDEIRFSSREGQSRPQLVVSYNPSTRTPTRTITATATRTSTAAPLPTLTQQPGSTPTHTQTQPSGATSTSTSTQPVGDTSTPTRTATVISTSVGNTWTFVPVADTYVDSGSPSNNYGSLTTLRGDGSPVVRSYLRFNLQDVNGTVTRATLRIFANSASSGGYEIRSVTNNTWGELTMTYSNAPAVGNVLGSTGAFSAGVWTSVDITSYITGDGAYNVALTVPGSTAISFASREAGNNAPQLIIQTQGGTGATITPTRTPTRTPTAGSTPSGSVVLVGAGDITSCNRNQDELTAQLLDNIPGTVFTTGDNAYVDGTYTEYLNCYDPTWGRHKSRTKPTPGNHEYLSSGAAGYFQYFNNIPSYYVYNLGSWRIYALNSEISVSSTSAQVTWLKNDLAANPTQCVLAYWHKPRWSSGSNHGDNSPMQTIWQILHDAGAELVLNGHEHHYERFSEMNAAGTAVQQGLREIVVGTGGAQLYPFGTPFPASQVRNNTAYGVLKLTLHSGSYDWEFIPAAGSTFTDSGSDTCH